MTEETRASLSQLFTDYFDTEPSVSSLEDFYHHSNDAFINLCPKKEISAFWNKEFKKEAEFRGIQYSKKQPDWAEVLQRVVNRLSGDASSEAGSPESKSSNTTPTNKKPAKRSAASMSSNSSKSDSCPLTREDMQQFEHNFKSMSNADKWFLRKDRNGNNVFVEDVLFAFGKSCDYEHPAHSYILDVADPCWMNFCSPENPDVHFTLEDRKRILETGNTRLPTLNSSIKGLFDKYVASITSVSSSDQQSENEVVDTLFDAATESGFFKPRTDFDRYWIQQTLIGFLDLYRGDKLHEMVANGSEMDFVVQCWSKLYNCFDDVATVGLDRTCVSTLVRLNSQRVITGVKPIDDKHSSVRPDLLVLNDGHELAVGECAKGDCGGVTKKELVEKDLHVPKLMKDMFNQAMAKGKNRETLARKLRIVAFNENRLRMQVSILDCPQGFVSRLLRLEEQEIPLNPSLITSSLFPLMKSALQAKAIVKESSSELQNHQKLQDSEPGYAHGYTLTDKDEGQLYLPASLTVGKRQKT